MIACHEVSIRTFVTALDALAGRILRLPALPYRDRTPAFLNLEFLDKLAAQPAAAHTPDARATFTLCKQDVVARPNVVKSGSHDLRVST
jgi:hypothetical protein